MEKKAIPGYFGRIPDNVIEHPDYNVRPAVRSEYSSLRYAIARAFNTDPEKDADPSIPAFIDFVPEREDFAWGAFFRDVPIGGVFIVPFTVYMDGIILNAAGLTGVGVIPEFRHRGVAYNLLTRVHKFLVNEGFDIVVLHSAADMLYRKLGYELVFTSYFADLHNVHVRSQFGTGAAENADNTSIVEIKKYGEIERNVPGKIIDRLYYIRENSPMFIKRRFKTLRSVRRFRRKLKLWLRDGKHIIMKLIRDDINDDWRPVAYALIGTSENGKVHIIREIYSENYGTSDYRDILTYFIQNISEKREISKGDGNKFSENIRIRIALYMEDGPVKKILQEWGVGVYEVLLTGNMAKILDPSGLLKKMEPIFTVRWGNACRSRFAEDKISALSPSPDKEDIVPPLYFGLTVDDNLSFIFVLYRETVRVISRVSEKEMHLPSDAIFIGSLTADIFELTSLIFGIIPHSELDLSESPDYDKVAPFLDVLFPYLSPVWDYGEDF